MLILKDKEGGLGRRVVFGQLREGVDEVAFGECPDLLAATVCHGM